MYIYIHTYIYIYIYIYIQLFHIGMIIKIGVTLTPMFDRPCTPLVPAYLKRRHNNT